MAPMVRRMSERMWLPVQAITAPGQSGWMKMKTQLFSVLSRTRVQFSSPRVLYFQHWRDSRTWNMRNCEASIFVSGAWLRKLDETNILLLLVFMKVKQQQNQYLTYYFMYVGIIDNGDHQDCERGEATENSNTHSSPDKVHTYCTNNTHLHLCSSKLILIN